ncbi:M20/M25/M40 family metallo-hydrolase [Amycolatopsis sp. NPDC047767]|uniref:M20/M25/M40 family metallo-hydrolase n=1 Tax=Amycolatopsis sp. NPDC047767 TaxID=3156765 RepID=UPI003451C612
MPAHAVPLLQDLIRINTVNPPGDEGQCVAYVERLLSAAGILTKIFGLDDRRTNLIARVPGRGEAPPLLLHAHSDVVGVTGQNWLYPPFDGLLVEGEVWGRGAIDMKGGLAMMLASLLNLRERGEPPAGDVVLAVVADEEAGSESGAGFLVREHPELFDDVRYAIGEEGGAGVELGGVRFHPIVVAEKRAAWLRLRLRGAGGHGSRLAPPDATIARLGGVLTTLSGVRLPRHPTAAADRMLAALSDALPEPLAAEVARLRHDNVRDAVPSGLPLEEALLLDSVLRHTVNPTVVRASDKINVLPSEITVDLDGRILPGEFTMAGFLREVQDLVGLDGELEVLLEGEKVPADIAEPEFGPFYECLTGVLRKLDPLGVPLPVVTPASTDARLFAQLGIRCYGWLPLRLPPGSGHRRLLHVANERVPVDALEFGTDCLTELLLGYR